MTIGEAIRVVKELRQTKTLTSSYYEALTVAIEAMNEWELKEIEASDQVVICPSCDKSEYESRLHWLNGSRFCRDCIYKIWTKGTKGSWKPGPNNRIWPER